jgi:membrane fusion protein, adhesin transport system
MNLNSSIAKCLNEMYRKVSSLSLTYVLAIGFVIFVAWGAIFDLDQTITTHGQIISEEKTQIIQAVDGGVLTELRAHEGQEVVAGEILAVLQKDTATAGYSAALAELEASQATLASVQEEYGLTQKLLLTGDVGYLEVARLKRQLIEMQGRIKINQAKLDQQKVYLDHTNLTSPLDGTVKLVKVNTIGGALRPGEEIMEVAPKITSIVIEVKINPADIGLLKVGLPANVKFDTFDYSIYGSLKGRVSYIGPDILSEQGTGGLASTFYRAHIEVPPEQLQILNKQNVDVKLGMSAMVDIKTGSRSVLRYIFKPIYKGFEGALHEK